MNTASTDTPTQRSEVLEPTTAANSAVHQSDQRLIRPATFNETLALTFPKSGYVGIAAEFAEVYCQEYESPKEFLFFDCLALIGICISGRIRADFALPCQPRLYVLKVAESAWRRKSTSTRLAEEFVTSAIRRLDKQKCSPYHHPRILYGVGSAEGLALCLEPNQVDTGLGQVSVTTRRAALVFDEFRRLEAKASIQNSALRPMVNELYESNRYENVTKLHSFNVQDGHLALLSNTTDATYRNLIDSSEFADIGFLNRLLLVTSNSWKRVAQPKAPPESVVDSLRKKLAEYIEPLPPLNDDGSASTEIVIPLTPGARELWNQWYCNLEETRETARLDNLGMRLMGLLAFGSGQSTVDEDLLRSVLDILEYERRVREINRPIEAENPMAKMEGQIRNALMNGPLSERDLRRHTNADRQGLKIFKQALQNLRGNKEVFVENRKCALVPESKEE